MADKTYNLKFKMSDGSTVDAGNFVVPEGPQGPKGDTPTKEDIGLGNVPNVSTDNQTPTYTVASTLAALASGEKLSVAMGKLAKAVSSLISHIADKNNPHAVTAKQAGAAPAVESTDYPGCYYRTVNGVVEWINPPMVEGVEYRTTERCDRNPVYAKCMSCGQMPNASMKTVNHGISDINLMLRCTGCDSGKNSIPFTNINQSANINAKADIYANNNSVYLTTTDDRSAYEYWAFLYYTKV